MRRSISTLAIPLCLSILSSCATFRGKLSEGVQADVGYFTDSTVSMMREANFGFTRGERSTRKSSSPGPILKKRS